MFQAFMAMYQLGKVVGVGVSGQIMHTVGYAGIFAGAVITWMLVLLLVISYHFVSKN